MGLSFGAPITTKAGTSIITRAGTVLVARIRTASGTKIFSSTTTTKFAAGAITGFKVAVPFDFPSLTTNLTTYANVPGTAGGSNQLPSGKYAPVPWAGSVLGFGVRSSSARTAGYASFTVMDGGTALAGTTLTANSTNTSNLNLTLLGVSAKTFGLNRLRVRVITSAALAGHTKVNGIVWVEV